MENNKFKLKKTDLTITVALLLGIIIVVNFFSYSIFYRLDLTDKKVYSISDASKKTVAELNDIVNIKAYFSGSLPSQLLTLRQEVEDTLEEYVAYSGSKIKLEVINPDDDEKLKTELNSKGIPELTFEVVEKDKHQLIKGYMGISINYGDKSEVIPAIKQDVSDLEYQLTTKIKKVSSGKIPIVAFLTSQGSIEIEKGLSVAREKLSELYDIQEATLSEKDPSIDDEVSTLIIAGPKEKFNDDQLKAINKFLSKGKSLLVLLDGVNIGDGLTAAANASGLETLLDKYGIKVNKDLVADPQSGMASFSQGFFSFSTPYPFWPKIIGTGFATDYAAVSGLENVVLPWVSSVTVNDELLKNVSVSKLLSTTNKSWAIADNFQILPNQTISPSTDLKKFDLAVSVNGEIKNAYPQKGENDKFQARIVVVGDSDFATDGFVNSNPDNLNLFLNLVDSISMDDALIKIRSKAAVNRPIDETKLDDTKRLTLKYFNVFGITVIVLVLGIGRYYMRRRSRFIDDF